MSVIQRLIDGKIISQPIDEANGEGISTKVWKNDTFLEISLKMIGEAVFIDCEFRSTEFSQTQFFTCLFINCKFIKTDFYKAAFFDTQFFNCTFKDICLQRADSTTLQKNLQQSQFLNCNFKNSNLQSMQFSETLLVSCIFTRCNLRYLNFYACEFVKLQFHTSELKEIQGSEIKMWHLNNNITSDKLETLLFKENSEENLSD